MKVQVCDATMLNDYLGAAWLYRYSCLEYYNFEEGVTFFTLRLVGFSWACI